MAEYDINGTIFYQLALRHSRGGALKLPWAAAWESLITTPPGLNERDDLVWRERLKNSRQLARSGVVQALAVRPGRVSARVEDPLTRVVHAVKMIVPVAQDEVWDTLADRAGATVQSAAHVASGMLEPSWIQPLLVRRADVTFEVDGKLLRATDAPQPLPAAAWLVFAERLEADSWLWVLFRGQTRDGLLDRMEALRQARVARQTAAASFSDALGEGLAMDHFWRMRVLPEELSSQEDAGLVGSLRGKPCGIYAGKRRLSRLLAGVIAESLKSKP